MTRPGTTQAAVRRPANGTAGTTRPPSPPKLSPEERKAARAQAASDAIDMIGMVVGVAGTLLGNDKFQLDSMTIGLHADATGAGIAEYAEQNSFVAGLLDRASVISGVSALLIPVLPMIGQIMANHGPANRPDDVSQKLQVLGVLPPDLLREQYTAQTQLKIARQQAKVYAETVAAQREWDELQATLAERELLPDKDTVG